MWTIDASGGSLRRLTHGPFHEGLPTWSPDGRWIYYRDDRADGRDISRIPAEGGTPQRVTRHGGFLAYVSADGRTLFYAEREGPSPLWSLALPDGPDRQVVDCVVSRTVARGPDGIYYVGCPPPDEAWLTPTMGVQQWRPRLYRFDPARGGSQLLGTLPSNGGFERLAISPKTRTILFGMIVTAEADLMPIETFR